MIPLQDNKIQLAVMKGSPQSERMPVVQRILQALPITDKPSTLLLLYYSQDGRAFRYQVCLSHIPHALVCQPLRLLVAVTSPCPNNTGFTRWFRLLLRHPFGIVIMRCGVTIVTRSLTSIDWYILYESSKQPCMKFRYVLLLGFTYALTCV